MYVMQFLVCNGNSKRERRQTYMESSDVKSFKRMEQQSINSIEQLTNGDLIRFLNDDAENSLLDKQLEQMLNPTETQTAQTHDTKRSSSSSSSVICTLDDKTANRRCSNEVIDCHTEKMIEHVSHARKYGFNIGIQLMSSSEPVITRMERKWAIAGIEYTHYDLLDSLKPNMNTLYDMFEDTPYSCATALATDWLPMVLNYLKDNQLSIVYGEQFKGVYHDYNAEFIRDLFYVFGYACRQGIKLHTSNGDTHNALSLDMVLDSLLNVHNLQANLEEIIHANSEGIHAIALKLQKQLTYGMEEDEEAYQKLVHSNRTLYYAIQSYFIHQINVAIGNDAFANLVENIIKGGIVTILVDEMLSGLLTSIFQDKQLQPKANFAQNLTVYV